MRHAQFAFSLLLAAFASVTVGCGDPVLGFPAADSTTGNDGALLDGDVLDEGIVLDEGPLTDAFVTLDSFLLDDAIVAVDDVPPTILRLNPDRDETDVAVNVDVIVTFSEPMDPDSTTGTLTVSTGGLLVPGTVTYRDAQLSFDPLVPLLIDTVYTATQAVGPTDLAGNELADGATWNFTTSGFIDTTRPFVVATSPLDTATFVFTRSRVIATFSETMDADSVASAFTLFDGLLPVEGELTYSGLTATFTPTNRLAGEREFAAAFSTDATDLAGNALAEPYIWHFFTGAAPDETPPTVIVTVPTDNEVEVDVAAPIEAIFSEPMDGTSVVAAFFLFDGLVEVDGSVAAAGATGTFTPTEALEPDHVYTGVITTMAMDRAGNALVDDYVWSFTTGELPDLRRPRVSFVVPADLAANVATVSQVLAVFTEPMAPGTITDASFIVLSLSGAVEGTIAFTGVTAVFTPDSPLAANTTYAAAVTALSEDLAGNPLEYNYVWNFTTGGIPDETSPAVVAHEPADLAVGVAPNAGLSVTFSEAMDPLTITTDRFLLSSAAGSVAGVVTGVGRNAMFVPEAPLTPATLYTATMRSAVFDLAGNAMRQDAVWTFTTGLLDDDLGPLVSRNWPADLAINVPVDAAITATFGDAMDVATVHTSSITLTALGVTDVAGTVRFDGATHAATFTPTADLVPRTLYTATVTTEVTDLAGNPVFVPHVWHFTTGANNRRLRALDLQTLNAFAAIAGAGLTNSNVSGDTNLAGNVALTPSVMCLGDGVACTVLNPLIDGRLYANDPEGVAARAQEDLTEAQIDAMGRPAGVAMVALAGQTLVPGIYSSAAAMSLAAAGVLTLDARGDTNAVWIFQVGSALNVGNLAQVNLINGGQARNVFWVVTTSATVGANALLRGNLLVDASISLGAGATVSGRLLCAGGQVTLLGNTVTLPPL